MTIKLDSLRALKRGLAPAAGTMALVLLGAPSSHAYVTVVPWATTAVVYYVNPQNNDVPEAEAIAAVRSAADAWSEQSRASFTFVYGGTTDSSTVNQDQKNTVLFRNDSSGGALAVTYYWIFGSNIGRINIVFYDGGVRFFTGSSGCSGGYYIEDVGTHEFGHALGLSHSSVGGATMVSGQGLCSTWKRTLADDDIAGVEYLYPPATTTSTPPRAPTGVRVISGLLDSIGPTGLTLGGLGGGLPDEAAPAEPPVRTMVPVGVRIRRVA